MPATRRPQNAKVIAVNRSSDGVRLWLTGSALVLGALWALPGWGQEADVITSHGYSTFGELKYPADFPHLDYVNPDAPKGGEISIFAQGTFDTLNP